MKRIICSLAILFFATTAFSQRVYFIYMESEQAQPFFVKMGEQVYSSTSAGYLILSKLKDSVYNFTVGFPQAKFPEQSYSVEIRGKDKGFLVKNFGEKGWGLFDLQTLSVQMGAVAQDKSSTGVQSKEVSAFTDILAKAANDPSLRETPVRQEMVQPVAAVKKEPAKEVAAVPTVVRMEEPVKKETVPDQELEKEKLAREKKRADSIAAMEALALKEKKEREAQQAIAEATAKKQEAPVVKETIDSVATTTVRAMPSRDVENSITTTQNTRTEEKAPERPAPDTKQAVVPATVSTNHNIAEVKEQTVSLREDAYQPSVVRRRSESSTTEGFGLTFVDEYTDGKKDTIKIVIPAPRTVAAVREQPAADKRFLDITSDAKEDKAVVNSPVAKPACVAVAVESDFLKLRKRMAAKFNDDEMISEAVKTFRTKCFTVFHLRNLSTLFLSDAAKYKFFDASKPYVSDRENFGSLQAELKDETYVARFREAFSF